VGDDWRGGAQTPTGRDPGRAAGSDCLNTYSYTESVGAGLHRALAELARQAGWAADQTDDLPSHSATTCTPCAPPTCPATAPSAP
jgi:hypothetical protein